MTFSSYTVPKRLPSIVEHVLQEERRSRARRKDVNSRQDHASTGLFRSATTLLLIPLYILQIDNEIISSYILEQIFLHICDFLWALGLLLTGQSWLFSLISTVFSRALLTFSRTGKLRNAYRYCRETSDGTWSKFVTSKYFPLLIDSALTFTNVYIIVPSAFAFILLAFLGVSGTMIFTILDVILLPPFSCLVIQASLLIILYAIRIGAFIYLGTRANALEMERLSVISNIDMSIRQLGITVFFQVPSWILNLSYFMAWGLSYEAGTRGATIYLARLMGFLNLLFILFCVLGSLSFIGFLLVQRQFLLDSWAENRVCEREQALRSQLGLEDEDEDIASPGFVVERVQARLAALQEPRNSAAASIFGPPVDPFRSLFGVTPRMQRAEALIRQLESDSHLTRFPFSYRSVDLSRNEIAVVAGRAPPPSRSSQQNDDTASSTTTTPTVSPLTLVANRLREQSLDISSNQERAQNDSIIPIRSPDESPIPTPIESPTPDPELVEYQQHELAISEEIRGPQSQFFPIRPSTQRIFERYKLEAQMKRANVLCVAMITLIVIAATMGVALSFVKNGLATFEVLPLSQAFAVISNPVEAKNIYLNGNYEAYLASMQSDPPSPPNTSEIVQSLESVEEAAGVQIDYTKHFIAELTSQKPINSGEEVLPKQSDGLLVDNTQEFIFVPQIRGINRLRSDKDGSRQGESMRGDHNDDRDDDDDDDDDDDEEEEDEEEENQKKEKTSSIREKGKEKSNPHKEPTTSNEDAGTEDSEDGESFDKEQMPRGNSTSFGGNNERIRLTSTQYERLINVILRVPDPAHVFFSLMGLHGMAAIMFVCMHLSLDGARDAAADAEACARWAGPSVVGGTGSLLLEGLNSATTMRQLLSGRRLSNSEGNGNVWRRRIENSFSRDSTFPDSLATTLARLDTPTAAAESTPAPATTATPTTPGNSAETGGVSSLAPTPSPDAHMPLVLYKQGGGRFYAPLEDCSPTTARLGLFVTTNPLFLFEHSRTCINRFQEAARGAVAIHKPQSPCSCRQERANAASAAGSTIRACSRCRGFSELNPVHNLKATPLSKVSSSSTISRSMSASAFPLSINMEAIRRSISHRFGQYQSNNSDNSFTKSNSISRNNSALLDASPPSGISRKVLSSVGDEHCARDKHFSSGIGIEFQSTASEPTIPEQTIDAPGWTGLTQDYGTLSRPRSASRTMAPLTRSASFLTSLGIVQHAASTPATTRSPGKTVRNPMKAINFPTQSKSETSESLLSNSNPQFFQKWRFRHFAVFAVEGSESKYSSQFVQTFFAKKGLRCSPSITNSQSFEKNVKSTSLNAAAGSTIQSPLRRFLSSSVNSREETTGSTRGSKSSARNSQKNSPRTGQFPSARSTHRSSPRSNLSDHQTTLQQSTLQIDVDAEEERFCVVCFDAPADVALLSCGHQCLCEKCAAIVVYGTLKLPGDFTRQGMRTPEYLSCFPYRKGGIPKCPICRAGVESILKLGPLVTQSSSPSGGDQTGSQGIGFVVVGPDRFWPQRYFKRSGSD